MPSRTPSVARGIAVGAVAGILATLVMDQFLKLVSTGEQALEKQKKLADGESPWAIAHEQVEKQQEAAEQEGSTEKVARKLAEVTGHILPQEQKKSAGQAVHYTFGTLMGVAYAAAAEHLPEITTGAGLAYGTLLFLAADEIAVPSLQLAPPPTETPAADQLEHWAAHIVYGATLDLLRTLLRRLL
jgi:putative membrane protein